MISGNGSDVSLLIANIVAGALVGYVTKALAINMLFKEYPIIGGAEIIKDRENLEISMSTLVEEKLIKPSTMLEEFQKPEFKVSFEKLIDYIVENTLKENIKEIDSISHIDGAKNTSDNLSKFLNKKREDILEICIEVLFNNVLIEDILSNEQIAKVVDKLIIIILSIVFNNYQDVLAKFSDEFSHLKISDILSENLFTDIIENFDIKHLNFLFEKDNFKNYIDQLLELVDFENLILTLEKDIKNKSIADLLIKKPEQNPAQYIINNVQKLLMSEKGKIIAKDFLINLIDILEQLDIPLSSFLTKEIETKVLELVEKYLPDLLSKGEEWIALNRMEMQNLINQSIEEHLESENLIKQIIGNIIAQKLAERYKIVEGTIEELKKMAKKAGPDIIKIANRFLDNTNISDIIRYAKNNFLDYDALTEIIIEIILNYITKIDTDIFNRLMNTKLSEFNFINDIDFNKIIKDKLLPSLFEQLKEELVKLSEPEYRKKGNTFLIERLKLITDKNISEVINLKDSDNLKSIVSELIDFDSLRPFINKKIVEIIPDIIKNKSVNQVVNDNIKKDIYKKLTNFYDNRVNEVLKTLNQEKVFNIYQKTASIYSELSKNKLFTKQLTDTLINLMVNLIRDNKLLDGKIYVAVKESFARFSDEELKQEMDSFMGKELQPIKLLGAFLGAVVGILMYYLSFVPGYGKYVTGYAALLSYPLAYAVTEMGTNWLAIRMLFKPYEPKRILGIKLPFTPGVFPKNKKALADSMVNFIDKKLLNKDNMVKILERHQLKWKVVIKEVVSKNNYQVIDETLNNYARENYDSVSPIILDAAFNEINKNHGEISRYLVEEVKNIDIKDVDLDNTKIELFSKIDQTNPLIKEFIAKYLTDFYNQKKRFGDIVSSEKLKVISNNLSLFAFAQVENVFNHKNKIYDLLNNYDYLLDRKVYKLISPDILSNNKNNFTSFVINTVTDEKIQNKAIEYFNNQILKSGLSSKKTMGEIFDGKLIKLILKESGTIMGFFAKYIHNLAINKKDEITDIILHDVEKKGIVETMLVRFGGVRNDIKGIVDVLVDNKLETYLKEKENEIHQIFNSYVENSLSKIKLFDLGINDDIFDKSNIKKLFKGILNSEQFVKIIESILNAVIEDIFRNMTLKEIMQTVDFNDLKEVGEKFSPEINTIIDHTKKNILRNKTDIIKITDKAIFDISENTLLHLSFFELFSSPDTLINNLYSITDLVYKSDTFNYSKNVMVTQVISTVNNNLSEIVDYPILQRDISNMIYNLTINEINPESRSSKFKKNITESVKDITISFVEVLNENVERETKKVIEDILVNSLVDSLRINNREVMEPIDFDAIVRKEVNLMNPSRIEAMFDFAKPVFRLLVWYGALGGIIGLAVGIFEAFR